MESLKYEEILENLKIEEDVWLKLHEVDTILLKSGEGIYPDWEKLRILFSKDRIFIKYGESIPYGARLSGLASMSADHLTLIFHKTNEGIKVESSEYYPEGFRQPEPGDFIVLSKGVNQIYGEYMIMDKKPTFNNINIELVTPARYDPSLRVSYYDGKVFNNRNDCMHSDIVEGIYMKFNINKNHRIHKKYGGYHRSIKIKDIDELKLKIGSSYYNKTYPLK